MSLSKLLVALGMVFFTDLIFSQSATKVVENAEANFYVKSDSIRKTGNIVEFWQITDFKQARQNKKGEMYLSMDQRLLIDCARSTQTLTFIKVFSSAMATGNLIDSGSMSQNNKIPFGTTLEIIKNYVCR
jgi:hypothetical protein